MNLILIEKAKLTSSQSECIHKRLASGDPDVDWVGGWWRYQQGVFAFFHPEKGDLVALVEASGPAPSVGWWIDPSHRGQGFGRQVVDLLAEYLVAHGVRRLGTLRLLPGGRYDAQSLAMGRRLSVKFDELLRNSGHTSG